MKPYSAVLRLVAWMTAAIAVNALAAPGGLDATFGNAGYISFPFNQPEIGQVIRQPDGKLLLVGRGRLASGGSYHVAISRHLADGQLDSSYGSGGTVVARPGDPSLNHWVRSAALQGDGKLVVGSYTFNKCLISRFDASGALDATFGFGGYYVLYPGQPQNDSHCTPEAMRVDSAGNIFVAVQQRPYVVPSPRLGIAVVKLGPDGFPVTSFGSGGYAEYLHPTDALDVDALALQPDGKPVVYGNRITTVSPQFHYYLFRFTAGGNADASFNGDGFSSISTGTASAEASSSPGSLEVDASGRLIATGRICEPCHQHGFQTVRVLDDGTPDPGFATGGRYARIPSGIFRSAPAPEGGYFHAGWLIQDGQYRIEYQWLTSGGSPDPRYGPASTFGPPGAWFADLPVAMTDIVEALVLPDGRALVSGLTHVFRLRFEPAAAFDFGADGKADLIYRHETTGVAYVWHMNGATFDHDARLPDLDPRWRIAAVLDWDGDGYSDLLVRDEASGDVMLRYLDAAGVRQDVFLVNIAPGWTIEGAADLNSDGMTDIIWRNLSTGDGFVWYMYGTALVSDQLMFSVDPQWRIAGVADFDGDGQPDLLMRHATTGLAFIWYLNGAVPAGDQYLFSIDPVWEITMVADFNLDGSPDLVFRNRDTGVAFVWYVVSSTLAGSDFLFQVDPSWRIPPGS